MKVIASICFAAGLAAALPAAGAPFDMARATSGYLYFNMPGADMARHDGDLKNCVSNWAGGINPEPDPFNGPAGTGIIGGAVSGIMLSGWERARKAINIEHCMVAKGWRLVELAPEEGRKLAQLPQKDLAAALAPYVSAEAPHGDIVRIWQNEEIYFSTIIAKSPQNSDHNLLSLAALSPDNPPIAGISSVDPALRNDLMKDRAKNFWGPKAGGLAEVAAPGLGQTLLVYSLKVKKKVVGPFTYLERADPDSPMSRDFFGLYGGKDFTTQPDGTLLIHRAIVVKSGTWYVQGAYLNMDNCLGAPFFQAESGTSLYLGTFDLTGSRLTVDTDTTAVNQALSGLPMTVTPVQWVNGYTYPCHQMSMYALEYDGFPFAPGYHWGSRAHAGN